MCNNTFTSAASDVIDVVVSTTSAGRSALDQAGNIRLVGTGTVSSVPGSSVTIAASGVLSSDPDRSVQNCVIVPDVFEYSRAQADADIRAAGLIPQFSPALGSGSYVVYQRPQAGTCVTTGSRVMLNLRAGPRP